MDGARWAVEGGLARGFPRFFSVSHASLIPSKETTLLRSAPAASACLLLFLHGLDGTGLATFCNRFLEFLHVGFELFSLISH